MACRMHTGRWLFNMLALGWFLKAFVCDVAEDGSEEETEEERIANYPGGARCYYDALATGCPSSISIDGHALLCGCDYYDNQWLHVLQKFNAVFRTGPNERQTLASALGARLEEGGVISLDVGMPQRLQCGMELANVYPGTKFEASTDELYTLLGSMIYPEVRNKILGICVPGRIALQLICQHAFIYGTKDFKAAKAYALKAKQLFTMVDKCVDKGSPWSFPDLKKFLRTWQGADIPDWSNMAWYPDPNRMRAKRPEESEQHFFACIPIKDSECFPSGSPVASCVDCCDPAHGPRGLTSCFDAVFTFDRCCQTPPGMNSFW